MPRGYATVRRLPTCHRGEGAGDDDEEGESEDEDEDGGSDWEGPRLTGNGLKTKRRKQHSFLLHIRITLIPCPILPTSNHVDKYSLLITVLLIRPGVHNVMLTTVDKHLGVPISG
jgi:hypothetical protein